MSGRVVGMQAVVIAEPNSAIDQVAISTTSQVGSLDWFRCLRKGIRIMLVIIVLTDQSLGMQNGETSTYKTPTEQIASRMYFFRRGTCRPMTL